MRKKIRELVFGDLAERILGMVFQSWGQTAEQKTGVLNKAFHTLHIDAQYKYVQSSDKSSQYELRGKEEARAQALMDDLSDCFPLGDFHEEAAAIDIVLEAYSKRQDEVKQL